MNRTSSAKEALVLGGLLIAATACSVDDAPPDVVGAVAAAESDGSAIARACRGESSCFSLDGLERDLCRAYKGGSSCFAALDGNDRGWCRAIKGESSCFAALDGAAVEACRRGEYPSRHRYWARCGNVQPPTPPVTSPRMAACRRERSCFSALDGVDQGRCRAYMDGASCFAVLDGEERGWCRVMKDGASCFAALDGAAQNACRAGSFPEEQLFWKQCAAH